MEIEEWLKKFTYRNKWSIPPAGSMDDRLQFFQLINSKGGIKIDQSSHNSTE